jgi:hypothetical protein
MSYDRRRPVQPHPTIEPGEQLVLRLSSHTESKPAIKTESGRLAAEVMQLLRNRGFDCVDASGDATPRRLH